MKAISLFSGVGCIDHGFEQAGIEVVAMAESDSTAQAVLRRHWPDKLLFEDVRDVKGKTIAMARAGSIGLVFGGSPCQDWSVAGAGQGLDGQRAGLFNQIVRIAAECMAPWVVWENVPAVLSRRHAEDFSYVLGRLTGHCPVVPVGGWGSSGGCVGAKRWAVWRVLDLQYFGAPQRRRRLIVVSGPGGQPRPEILFERACLQGDPRPSKTPGAITSTLTAPSSGGWRVDDGAVAGNQVIAGTLTTGGGPDDNSAAAHHLVVDEVQITSPVNRANPKPGDPCPTMAATSRLTAVFAGGPRRLTPLECERLQSMPDDWTRWRDDGSEIADSPRYKMIGNGAGAIQFKWIGQRLLAAL